MKKTILSLLALCLLSTPAAFGSITTVLNTGPTRLSDNSLEVLQNAAPGGGFMAPGAGDTILDVGDRLITIFRIDQVTSPFPGPTDLFGVGSWTDELTGVSVIEVTGKAAGVGTFSYSFGPAATDPLGLGWSAGTMVATYSDPANDYSGTPASIAGGIAEASGGSAFWEFGFAGEVGESWTATTISDDLSVLAVPPLGLSPGFFNLGLEVITDNSAPDIIDKPVGTPDIFGSGNIVAAGSFPTVGGWHVLDNIDISLNIVPEPTAFLVWGLLGLSAGTVAARKRFRS